MEDTLTLYGHSFQSRLILGTARYESPSLLAEAIRVADPAMLTVSLRHQLSGREDAGEAFWSLLRETGKTILPNTAGCHTVREAVTTACMARELFETNLIKLEVLGDEVNLQPDPFALVEAATELIRLGFHVLPYCTEDWVLCRRLMEVGCEVLMPWAAPIGTGQGPRNPAALRELRRRAPNIPLIVDAGIGLPSQACQVMEWGFDAVLLNTAVSRALNPVRMAELLPRRFWRVIMRIARGRWLCSNSLCRARRRLVCLSRKVQMLGDRLSIINSTPGRIL
jgi:thiazole synthase